MAEPTFSFGLSQKVNDAQSKRFVELKEEQLEEARRNKFKRNRNKSNINFVSYKTIFYSKYCRKATLEK